MHLESNDAQPKALGTSYTPAIGSWQRQTEQMTMQMKVLVDIYKQLYPDAAPLSKDDVIWMHNCSRMSGTYDLFPLGHLIIQDNFALRHAHLFGGNANGFWVGHHRSAVSKYKAAYVTVLAGTGQEQDQELNRLPNLLPPPAIPLKAIGTPQLHEYYATKLNANQPMQQYAPPPLLQLTELSTAARTLETAAAAAAGSIAGSMAGMAGLPLPQPLPQEYFTVRTGAGSMGAAGAGSMGAAGAGAGAGSTTPLDSSVHYCRDQKHMKSAALTPPPSRPGTPTSSLVPVQVRVASNSKKQRRRRRGSGSGLGNSKAKASSLY